MDRKEQTKQKLIQAVGQVLEADGFRGLGVNKIARAAGVDKVLVYRYFGGLPNLIKEYSRTVDFWPTIEELLGPDPDRLKDLPTDQQVAEFFKCIVAALKKRPATQDVLAWELLERNEITQQFEAVRIKSILEYFDYFEDIPDDDNLKAIVVLMGGAIIHLMVKYRIDKYIGGIDLETSTGWERINTAIDLMLRGIFDE